MYLNKVQLIGNLTKPVELKATTSGIKVAQIGIATNRKYAVNGEKREEVEYHTVVVYGKQAEVITQYCNKGDQLYIEGRLQTRTWEQDGVKKYKTEIILENFQFGKKAEVRQSSELSGIDKQNQSVAEKLFESGGMTDDELVNLQDIPF